MPRREQAPEKSIYSIQESFVKEEQLYKDIRRFNKAVVNEIENVFRSLSFF